MRAHGKTLLTLCNMLKVIGKTLLIFVYLSKSWKFISLSMNEDSNDYHEISTKEAAQRVSSQQIFFSIVVSTKKDAGSQEIAIYRETLEGQYSTALAEKKPN